MEFYLSISASRNASIATQKLFIERFAHYAAIAIKNAQVFDTLIQRRIQELEILQKIDRELSRTLELETLLNNSSQTGTRTSTCRGSCDFALQSQNLGAMEISSSIWSPC